jgi:hypothetical protein
MKYHWGAREGVNNFFTNQCKSRHHSSLYVIDNDDINKISEWVIRAFTAFCISLLEEKVKQNNARYPDFALDSTSQPKTSPDQ